MQSNNYSQLTTTSQLIRTAEPSAFVKLFRVSQWADNGFSRYCSRSNDNQHSEGVVVARPAARLENGQFLIINKVNARASV